MLIITNFIKLSWWTVRLSALVFLFGIIYDNEVLILISSVIFIHLKLGLEAVINDYIHTKIICSSYLVFLRLLNFKTIAFILDFLL